ncbi:MAG: glycosyltransferase [Candidatus Omnitrophica bacterium]|nr:glycosyltransferase [Candidatus Omnitrophota bacterium]
MDIAIVTPTLYCLGGERQIEFLASGLQQKGYTVTVYCFFDDGPIADILQTNSVKVVRLYSRLIKKFQLNKSKNYFFDDACTFRKSGRIIYRAVRFSNEFWAALKLLLIFLNHRPQVVHLYQNQTKMAILVSKLCGVKKIIYTETSLIGDWLTPTQLSLMKSFWKFCDVVVVLCAAMRDHMLNLKLVDNSKLHLIPTMFPSPVTGVHRKERNNTSKIQVGIVGKLILGKGHIFFLKAANLINKRFSNVKFIVAGDGYLKEKLKKTTKELGIEKNIEFLGLFKNIEDVMSQIDIFVQPSLSEGMSLALLEAAAYGKPIVATDVGGSRELIIDGETGFLIPPKNPEALAEAISKLIDNPQKRTDFSNKVIKRFKAIYSLEKVFPQIERLYRNE